VSEPPPATERGERIDPLSWIEAPLVVEDPSSVDWFAQADVVVVGVGGAGVAAAIQAREDGASVIAIDRFESGGATAWSGGVYYAGNTRHQRQAGIDDPVDEMFAYLKKELRGTVSDETLRDFCETSSENLEWMERHGVRFSGALTKLKTYYPPPGYYLYYSGNERIPEYEQVAKPAPRGHRTFVDGNPRDNTGWAMFGPLRDSAEAQGVRLLTHAAVNRLVMDGGGRVIGVQALMLEEAEAIRRHQHLYDTTKPAPFNHNRRAKARVEIEKIEAESGKRRLIRANRGVVLSTGGFEVNAELLARECRTDWSKGMPIGMLGSDGAGLVLGRSTGAVTKYLDHTFVGQRIVPPASYLRGMLIGIKGTRFVSEEAYLSSIGMLQVEQSDGKAWIVLDRKLMRTAIREAMPDKQPSKQYGAAVILNVLFGGTKCSTSIRGLAKKLKVDPDNLEKTLERYNRAADGEIEDEYQKPREYLSKLDHAPYFAINVSVTNRLQFVSVFTLGGLIVDEESGAVLRDDGSVIEGLYSAGRTAVGLPSISYVSGMSISDCIYSGRRAGRWAAKAGLPTEAVERSGCPNINLS
jgi:3-oxo-5alpha-steroid 4-dehydrogenase